MNRPLFVVLATTAALQTMPACILRPYESGTISCDVDGTSCPEGFACLDPKKTTKTTCVKTSCGDGQLDVTEESCDDANDNDLDLCVECKEKGYIAAIKRAVGFGPGDADPLVTPLGRPSVVASDANGNLFIGSIGTNVITRLELTADEPKITTFAGNGSVVSIASSEATPPNEVATLFASALAIDGLGTLFIADVQDSVIRRVDPLTGQTVTVVGNGIRVGSGDGQLGNQASIDLPISIAVDGDGTLFFVERETGDPVSPFGTRIRRLDRRTGRLTTIAATVAGRAPLFLPEPPTDIAFADNGDLYAFSPRIGLTVLSLADGGSVAQGLRAIAIEEGSCPIAGRDQERFMISGDGRRAFYASDRNFIQVDIPPSGTNAAATCVVLGEAPQSVEDDTSLNLEFNLAPGDVAVVGDDVFFADPGNGVVWSVKPVVKSQRPDVVAGLQTANEDGDAFERLLNEGVLEFAKQTDGHLVAGPTDVCNQGPLAFDSFEFFASFPELHRVVLSECTNVISVVAGTGIPGFSGDGGPAINAQLSRPAAAARGADQAIYIADRDNNRIRRVLLASRAGEGEGEGEGQQLIIETYIGEGSVAPGQARELSIVRPSGLAVDDSGGLFIADSGHHRIVRIDLATGATTTVMGRLDEPGFNGDDLPADQTLLNEPASIVFLPFSFLEGRAPIVPPGGLLIIAERGGHRIRATVVPPFPFLPPVITLAGTGEAGGHDDAADGRNAEFFHPRGLMFRPPSADLQSLGFFVVDAVDRVRSMTLTVDLARLALPTTVTTATALTENAGDGSEQETIGEASRDDGGRDSALFRSPTAMTFIDSDHAVVVDGLSGRLRLVTTSTGAVRTVAGMPDGLVLGPTDARLAFVVEPMGGPADVVLDVGSEPAVLYVSEANRGRLRRFTLKDPADPASWTTQVVLLDQPLVQPAGLAIDVVDRRLYVADQGAHAVYGIDLDSIADDSDSDGRGFLTTVAGIPFRRGAAGDDGLATAALLNEPEGLAFLNAPNGDRFLVVADTGNNRVRRVALRDDAKAVITAVLGDGDAASGGEGSPARAFPVQGPRGLAIDDAGNLFVTSTNAIRMVQAGDGGLPDGADDVATIYGKPPRQDFPASVTRCLSDIALAPSASGTPPTAWVLDSCLGLLLPLERP